ncbi:MAG: DUF2269 domain-containing protein [Candidatus Eremiobacteraeota bacterium]|nr:DUF2269 domain-containing protein [Candidatus Eremiobacteraeota bacterium]
MVWLKTLHVIGAIVWLGNFVVTGVWSARAFASRRPELRAFAVREILFTDAVFTLAFGSAVVASGIALAASERIALWATLWTRAALEIVIAAGIVWLAVLLPLEIGMRRQIAAGSSKLGRSFVWWNVAGWAVTLALFCVVYIMFQKPA